MKSRLLGIETAATTPWTRQPTDRILLRHTPDRVALPSFLHETLLALVRRDPAIVRTWAADFFAGAWADGEVAAPVDPTLVSLAPIERRADLVLELPNLMLVVEAQLRRDDAKLAAWPVYQSLLRSRTSKPVAVVVLTTKATVEAWARTGIELGPAQWWRPVVIGPSSIPRTPTRAAMTRLPELAVLSFEVHSGRPDDEALSLLRNAVGAIDDAADIGLADDAARLYLDAVLAAAPGLARRVMVTEMEQRTYPFKSDFARKYVEIGRDQGLEEGRTEGRKEGRKEGLTEGRAASILTLLTARALPLTDAERKRITDCTDIDTLERWLVSAATASSADEIFG